jgi:hypothetical protein
MLKHQRSSGLRAAGTVCTFLLLGFLTAGNAPAQEFAWAMQMGGASVTAGSGIAVDSAGNVYTTGYFSGTATFGTTTLTASGYGDTFVAKLNSSGVVQWAKRMGGVGATTRGRSIAVDGSGNTYVTGTFDSIAQFGTYTLTAPAYCTEIFVEKLGPDGTVLWATRMGGTSWDESYSMALDGSGNTYVTGYFQGTATFGTTTLTSSGNQDIFVAKLNSSGVVQWAKRMGGVGDDEGKGIALDGSGNTYVTGRFSDVASFGSYNLTPTRNPTMCDIFVEKLNSSGTVLWAKRMGGSNGDQGFTIAVDADGNTYVTGWFYGWADFGTFTLDTGDTFVRAMFIEKLNSSGVVQWAINLGGGNILNNAVAIDGNRNTYVSGSFSDTATFGTTTLTSAGSYDAFVEKFDAIGTVLWVRSVGGLGQDEGGGIAVDAGGTTYVTGDFQGTATFGPYTLTATGTYNAFVTRLRECGSTFVEDGSYGLLLFHPFCTADASGLPASVYNSMSLELFRTTNERFFLSSRGIQFSSVVVEDALYIDGSNSGLGPYTNQPGVPPFLYDAPIEENFVPWAPYPITDSIPAGRNTVLFELRDLDGQIYGNTAVYLVADCGIYMDKTPATRINFVSHDDQWQNGIPGVLAPEFDVRDGLLSELRADRNFSRVACLGRFADTPATLPLADPPAGDGFYFLAKEWSAPPGGGCFSQHYGDSNLTPDPRDALNGLAECP